MSPKQPEVMTGKPPSSSSTMVKQYPSVLQHKHKEHQHLHQCATFNNEDVKLINNFANINTVGY